jgi:ADP-ribosyl-[dinitrogen reductase] hydrolase
MMQAAPPVRERFRGALLGLAVGDALGAPAQFLTAEQVVERWGVLTEMVGGGAYAVRPGETTDATGMMLCLAESLVDGTGFRPDDVMRHYLAWFDGRPRDVSLTVRTVLLAIRSGTAWDIASRRAHEILGRPTADNASLMRCAPVALRFFADPDKRRDAALRESTLTHFDPVAGWACAAFDESLVAAMAGRLRERVPALAADFAQEDARVGEALLSALDAEPQEIHSSALVMDTLKTALWAVLRTHSFEDAVCTTVNLGDDADANGAVTGALAGATYGARSIPARWTTALLGRQHILDVADRLATLAGVAG